MATKKTNPSLTPTNEDLLTVIEELKKKYGELETEKKNSELELDLLVYNTDEAFVLVDKNLKIASFNQQFYALYIT